MTVGQALLRTGFRVFRLLDPLRLPAFQITRLYLFADTGNFKGVAATLASLGD